MARDRKDIEQLASWYRTELLPSKRHFVGDPERDLRGTESSGYAAALRFLGVSDYYLRQDVSSFRRNLQESAAVHLALFGASYDVSRSYISVLSYHSVFDALAATDWPTASRLSHHVALVAKQGQVDVHAFDLALGTTLASFVLCDHARIEERLDTLRHELARDENRNFAGYGVVFDAIMHSDTVLANTGLRKLVRGHMRECRSGVFRNTDDALLCVWGLGLANLCRKHGLRVDGVEPMIPSLLLAGE